MSATVITFPCAAPGPCRFSREARDALKSLAAQRPRLGLAFDRCDDGDEWAKLGTTSGQAWPGAPEFVSGGSLTVAALPGGRMGIIEDDEMWPERFTTGAAVVAALRAAGV